MEILKIVGLTLIIQVLIYYIITCFVKWQTGNFYSDIFNPFYSWQEAYLREEWQKGYNAALDDAGNTGGNFSTHNVLDKPGKGKSYSVEILKIAKDEKISYEEALVVFQTRQTKS